MQILRYMYMYNLLKIMYNYLVHLWKRGVTWYVY